MWLQLGSLGPNEVLWSSAAPAPIAYTPTAHILPPRHHSGSLRRCTQVPLRTLKKKLGRKGGNPPKQSSRLSCKSLSKGCKSVATFSRLLGRFYMNKLLSSGLFMTIHGVVMLLLLYVELPMLKLPKDFCFSCTLLLNQDLTHFYLRGEKNVSIKFHEDEK